jgi:hypothetical protein
MTFDPISQSWIGNEDILNDFDTPIRQPTLIPHAMHIAEISTAMIFDPTLMKWVGNEEELDAHLFDHIVNLNTPSPSPFFINGS